MKTKYFILIVLAGMSLISCSPCATEKPEHEIESINELIDSMAFRSCRTILRDIQCARDTLFDTYNIITCAVDTMGIDTLDVDAWYKRLVANVPPKSVRDTMKFYRSPEEMRREVESHQFMIRNATKLVEKLCKTSKESYRFCNKDSVDYSITLNDNPKQFLKAARFTIPSCNNNEFYVSYTKHEPVKVTAEPYDRKPVQELLKKFLSEYKNVQQYQVSFDWDEGLPFPSRYDCQFYLNEGPRSNKDSLAASHITGTHYVIPVADEKKEEVIKDFTNRILQMAVERPIPGSRLRLNLHTKGNNKYYIMEEYEFRSQKYFLMPTYQIKIGRWETNTIHILELDFHDSPRYAIPLNWEPVLRTHNTEIHYLNKVEPKRDTNFFQH